MCLNSVHLFAILRNTFQFLSPKLAVQMVRCGVGQPFSWHWSGRTQMANIKSQKKRVGTNELRRVRNMSVRSKMRTLVKNALTAIEEKDAEKIKTAVPEALSAIDRAASKGVIHGNSAARKKSMIQSRVTG